MAAVAGLAQTISTTDIRSSLAQFDASDANYATRFVDHLLESARLVRCSDVHLQPTPAGMEIHWRLDGVLQSIGAFPAGKTADIVTRLKVLSELLTYRTDVPQEGRIRRPEDHIEMRVSTFPTIHGERAVVRLFAAAGELADLRQLGLPNDTVSQVESLLRQTSGALLITGPAGSGKTTTGYACLRRLVTMTEGGRSIVSLEDPVEVVVPGISQSQTNPAAEFDLHSGLKSMLRQDPEVIFVGEMRDRQTAEVAFQAALTGQLMITTFHAGSAAEAVSRLTDMGLEPYLLRSALLGIVCQRLVRKLCQCATPVDHEDQRLGLPVAGSSLRTARGCEHCRQTGYAGRTVLSELLVTQRDSIRSAILDRQEAAKIEQLAIEDGMCPLGQSALAAVESGVTSPEEVIRVFGVGMGGSNSR